MTSPYVLAGGPLSQVIPERVSWFWEGRIPFGKLTMLDGDPGVAKSLLTLDLAARLSRGDPMPDGQPTERATSILLSAEDGLADTIRPRLDALGADTGRVHGIIGAMNGDGPRAVTLPDHLDALRAKIVELEARFVVIDPLMAYLSLDVNSRIDHDVRRVLAPMAQLADDTRAALVIVRHLNKSSGGPALYRGGGSIAFIGAARSGLLVACDPDDATARVLAVTKHNLAREAPSLRFEVQTGSNGAARIEWRGTSEHRADGLLAVQGAGDERAELDGAVGFLREFLADGPRTVKELELERRAAGFSERTLQRARRTVGVQAKRTGGVAGHGCWTVALPPKAVTYPCHGSLRENGDCGGLSAKTAMTALDDGLSEPAFAKGDAWEAEP